MHGLQALVGSRLAKLGSHEVPEPLHQLEKDERVLVQASLHRGMARARH